MTMKRYYKKFQLTEPMDELAESEALERGRYVVELQAPHRFERFAGGDLRAVYYPPDVTVDDACRDSAVRYPDADVQRYSSPEVRDGLLDYSVWFIRIGNVEKRVRIEEGVEPDSTHYRRYRYSADGELLDYTDHVYDADGLLEINLHAPDGSILSRLYDD